MRLSGIGLGLRHASYCLGRNGGNFSSWRVAGIIGVSLVAILGAQRLGTRQRRRRGGGCHGRSCLRPDPLVCVPPPLVCVPPQHREGPSPEKSKAATD